ncbi:UDP-glucose 4-epimerase GalE [Temperatibacter marinus]|uniref:UDP-glucose 4-epimerase n=1 Tax=Temperatibacter marinus TaxID=1456591 RepID=A0AA52EIL6_9PROT|nr:UDP-glucose 4-epimerase GalE [Temperatibacter marinus]WND03184.1 UDP-glucose 4-epimerase GalE [Temperatibacter marinus]
MAILVTGGAGYIGSHTLIEVCDAGEDVIVVDNLSTGFKEAIDSRAKFLQGDIGDQAFMQRVFEDHSIEAVIHFAGSVIVPESVENPLLYYRNNTENTRQMIEHCVTHQVKKFIFSSTAAIYGMPEECPVDETYQRNPISPYGHSKSMSELMLEDASKAYDFNFIALRYFNVAGADPMGRTGQSTKNATHLIKVACEAALGYRDELLIFGSDYDTSDGTCIRDYIHVSDLAAAHLCALSALRKTAQSEIINCGYGTGYSVLEVLSTVKKVSGVDFNTRFTDRRAGDSPQVVAKCSKIHEHLDWIPKYNNLSLIVEHAIEWERKIRSSAP